MEGSYPFQSTLPARGSDWHDHCHREPVYISIHAPRKGERLCPRNGKYFNLLISIHAPHKGERRHSTIGTIQTAQFQSTLPARGSDRTAHLPTTGNPHFNPRSPQGGATAGSLPRRQHSRISIHAPRKGERLYHDLAEARKNRKFQSTLPARGSDRSIL